MAVWEPSSNVTKNRERLEKEAGGPLQNPAVVAVKEIKGLRQTFDIETGYGDVNAWIEWVRFTVQSLNHTNC